MQEISIVSPIKKAYVFCHDGKIFEYSAEEKINVSIYNAYITKYISQGYSDFEAQWKTLEELMKKVKIKVKEVT